MPSSRLIAPLTGIRALAAFWVFLRHFRTELLEGFPALGPLAPLMNAGYLGVDLFFVLSGFILALTHLAPMTQNYGWRTALGFLWLRLGRVWPLTVVVLGLFGCYFFLQMSVGHHPEFAAELDPVALVQHTLLVQGWTARPLDWNGVDWSISAEWLAYLTFACAVVILGRFAAAARSRTVVALMSALLLVMIIVGCTMQDDTILLFSPDGYVISPGILAIRVLTEFWVGALLFVLLRNKLHDNRIVNLPLPSMAVTALLVVLYVVTVAAPSRWVRAGQPEFIGGIDQIAPTETIVVLPLFVVLIGTLTMCPRDPLSRLLSTRLLMLGGRVSFALYLSHPLVIGAFVTISGALHGRAFAAAAAATVVAAWAFAWVLWRFIEEPARRWARRVLPDSVRV